jgi:hypothetical protein
MEIYKTSHGRTTLEMILKFIGDLEIHKTNQGKGSLTYMLLMSFLISVVPCKVDVN